MIRSPPAPNDFDGWQNDTLLANTLQLSLEWGRRNWIRSLRFNRASKGDPESCGPAENDLRELPEDTVDIEPSLPRCLCVYRRLGAETAILERPSLELAAE